MFKGAAKREKLNVKNRALFTRRALSIILAEIDPAEVPEILRVGLFGSVKALAIKPRRGSSGPRRA